MACYCYIPFIRHIIRVKCRFKIFADGKVKSNYVFYGAEICLDLFYEKEIFLNKWDVFHF